MGDWDQWNDNGAVDTRTHNNIHALTARSVVPNPQTYDQNFSQTDDGANYKFEYDAKRGDVLLFAWSAAGAQRGFQAQGGCKQRQVQFMSLVIHPA